MVIPLIFFQSGARCQTGLPTIIGIEILAFGIKKNPQIEGIRGGTQEIKITQYADDTTVFLKNPESMSVLLDLLEKCESQKQCG